MDVLDRSLMLMFLALVASLAGAPFLILARRQQKRTGSLDWLTWTIGMAFQATAILLVAASARVVAVP